jgi:fructokinase
LEWFYEKESGERKDLKEIVDLARSGKDKLAKATLNRLTGGFAKAVSVMINAIDPDVIVIGGGVGTIDELYTDGVAEIRQRVFNQEFAAPVVRPLLGDSAGVFGAAFLTRGTMEKKFAI